MKFIEVTDTNGNKRFVNLIHIEYVMGNTIYLTFAYNSIVLQDCIECQESYEEIIAKIKERD